MKKISSFIIEIGKMVAIALLIALPIRYFIFQPFYVKGSSMEPNFVGGDYLIVDEISYRFKNPQRGEVVVFRYPNNPSYFHIKRIIGLPGEELEIKEGQVIIHGEEDLFIEESYLPFMFAGEDVKITLKEKEYFVMGDNRSASVDSRMWGALDRKNIIGRVYLRIWPFNTFSKIEAPAY